MFPSFSQLFWIHTIPNGANNWEVQRLDWCYLARDYSPFHINDKAWVFEIFAVLGQYFIKFRYSFFSFPLAGLLLMILAVWGASRLIYLPQPFLTTWPSSNSNIFVGIPCIPCIPCWSEQSRTPEGPSFNGSDPADHARTQDLDLGQILQKIRLFIGLFQSLGKLLFIIRMQNIDNQRAQKILKPSTWGIAFA